MKWLAITPTPQARDSQLGLGDLRSPARKDWPIGFVLNEYFQKAQTNVIPRARDRTMRTPNLTHLRGSVCHSCLSRPSSGFHGSSGELNQLKQLNAEVPCNGAQ